MLKIGKKCIQILDGLILSDASLCASNRMINSYFTITSIERDFVEHVRSVLPLDYAPIKIREAHSFTKNYRIYHAKESYCLRSHSSELLGRLKLRWYSNGKKFIPKDLDLTPRCIKYWFYGDGSTSRQGNSVMLTLSTECFSYDDCEFLKQQLIYKDLRFGIHKSGKGFKLQTNNSATVSKFFDYIKECELSCFNYKWKKPQLVLNKTSKYKGVCKNKNRKTFVWKTSIKNIHVGYFDTEIEAARAYDREARKIFGEQAILNFS